ncbi:VWA domain-containing protein [Prosthecobacter sp.]|uniref:vWA domain-containing protein n=1 Tax=Prosthecobacter sp. TaxID=1965333 RepID=UPI002487B7C7|nr:VWA domain-containing protein [Prosthecobacter sp.]MDI1312725.1 VWA domain-containing protein [Prosthecobacter sp.]
MNRLLTTVLTGWALLTGASNVQAQQPASRAIIVFDASGSMYGEVPGGVKIDIAKKVVSDIVGSIDPGMELGLMAYGHRKKGDCEDIELLVPPQPGSSAAILKAVAALEPKGKTPLTAAVIQAAKYLKYEEVKVSVILVSDGVETCHNDPCTAADELERLGIDFTCHVIGFDLKPGESSGLECLAKKTGGMYLSAKDAASLKSSLETAMKQVAKPVTTLVIEAKKSSGGALIEGATFQVFAEGGGENAIATGNGGRWSTELPKAGKFTISAKLNGKVVELEATVKEGDTVTKEVVFAESGIKAVAYAKEGGTAFEKDVSWDLFGPANAEGQRETIATSYEAKPFLKVVAGKYLLKATRGDARASVEVTVKDGAAQEVKLVLGSGNLKLSAISAEGQTAITKDLSWDIYSPADAEGQRKQLGNSYEAQPMFTLPSGPCLIVAQYGNAKGQQEVEVKAGETQNIVVLLGSGKLKLSVIMEEGGKPVAEGVSWDVLGEADAEGNRPKIAYSYDAQPTLALPAGKYEVEVVVGNAKGKVMVEIKAGATQEKVVTLGAGRIKLSALAVEGAEPLSTGVSWEIFGDADAEGNRVKASYSYDAVPTLSLPAGKYLAQLDWGSAKGKQEVEVAAGKLTEVSIVINAGTLALSALMAEGADPAPEGLNWDVFGEANAEGERPKASYSYDAQPKLHLTAGKYLVVATRGAAVAQIEVEVLAGKMVTKALTLNAGTLKISSSTPGSWEIFGTMDAEGNRKKITYSYDAEAKLFIPAGKVLVVRSEGDKKAEQEIEIKAGVLSEMKLDAK